MPSTLTIEGKMLGQRKPLFDDWSLSLPPELDDAGGRLTLRDLITRIVREEVAAFHERQQQQRVTRSCSAPVDDSPARSEWIENLLDSIQEYEQEITWFAAWAAYLGWQSDSLGILFAATIDAGGPEGEAVFDILVASARGEHEIGAMGRHVTRALLVASRPDGGEFIERLLLSAQRQEGLRQTILETVDEAHPAGMGDGSAGCR